MQDPHLSQKTFSQAHHPTKTREINGTETPHTKFPDVVRMLSAAFLEEAEVRCRHGWPKMVVFDRTALPYRISTG